MTSSVGGTTLHLSDVLSTEAFDDVINVADEVVINVGETIKTFVEREFQVKNLFLAKPVLLSRLKPPALDR